MRATLILVVMTGCCVSLAYRATAVSCGSIQVPNQGCTCAASCPGPANCKVTPVTPITSLTKKTTKTAEGVYEGILNEIVKCLGTKNIPHDVSHAAAKSLVNCTGKPDSIVSEFEAKLGKKATTATINGCITSTNALTTLFAKIHVYTPQLCTCTAA
jgi:hypothetical protein